MDILQDIQVFCINETELMGFDNIKCNKEVFSEINQEQDPYKKKKKSGPLKKELLENGKRIKGKKSWTLYKANYESCKL